MHINTKAYAAADKHGHVEVQVMNEDLKNLCLDFAARRFSLSIVEGSDPIILKIVPSINGQPFEPRNVVRKDSMYDNKLRWFVMPKDGPRNFKRNLFIAEVHVAENEFLIKTDWPKEGVRAAPAMVVMTEQRPWSVLPTDQQQVETAIDTLNRLKAKYTHGPHCLIGITTGSDHQLTVKFLKAEFKLVAA